MFYSADKEQAELIAGHYANVNNLYQPIRTEDFPEYKAGAHKLPWVSVSRVVKVVKSMNKKAGDMPGYLPVRIIAQFSDVLSRPLEQLS